MVKGPNAFSSSIIRSTFMICQSQIFYSTLNPQASVAQKIADEVIFRHFQGEGVEFFLIGPPSDFWCASFGNYRFKPFQISIFSEFCIKIMFWVRCFYSSFERMNFEWKRTILILTNKTLITSFYKKIPIVCRISDESALIRNFNLRLSIPGKFSYPVVYWPSKFLTSKFI